MTMMMMMMMMKFPIFTRSAFSEELVNYTFLKFRLIRKAVRHELQHLMLFKAIYSHFVYSKNRQTTNNNVTYIVETSTATCFRNINSHHRAVQEKKKVMIHNWKM
jgi:hypothetical protein